MVYRKEHFSKSDLLSASTASTEASLSEHSSHGGQTPPKDRADAWATPETSQAVGTNLEQSHPKRTRRSNRRKKKNTDGSGKVTDFWDYGFEDQAPAHREVVTVTDLFDFGPAVLGGAATFPKAAAAAYPNTTMEDYVATPVSPCRKREGPQGIVSTNPCVDVAPTVAPASVRTPNLARPKLQAAPTTLDLMLCAGAPDTGFTSSMPESHLSSPCKSRAMSASLGMVNATPCNTPQGIVSSGIVGSTPCNTPTGNRLADASSRTVADAYARTPTDASARTLTDASARTLTDASARTPTDASARTVTDASARTLSDASARTPALRAAPLSGALLMSEQAPAADAFTLGIEQGPYSPCRPRALFSTSTTVVQAPQSPAAQAGTVVADAMRSWLHSSGLPSGSAALEAQLRAALPETYED